MAYDPSAWEPPTGLFFIALPQLGIDVNPLLAGGWR
jgi:hypothetical protein